MMIMAKVAGSHSGSDEGDAKTKLLSSVCIYIHISFSFPFSSLDPTRPFRFCARRIGDSTGVVNGAIE